ncbi:MAG TPA: hypothetical protein VKX46_07795 [Ktedonobacteraceae bacterium]|nr:hypothetical protein [Ktedonobacteraceae bacterium]
MFNKDAILAQVQSGQIPQTWRILYPKSSHYITLIVTYLILVLILIFGIVYMNATNTVFVPGYSSDPITSESVFSTWRIIDYIVIAILGVAFLVAIVQSILDLSTIHNQALILTPEGFVLQKRRSVAAVAFADVASMSARKYRGTVNMYIKPRQGGKTIQMKFDGRFGNVQNVVNGILSAQHSYAQSAVRQA